MVDFRLRPAGLSLLGEGLGAFELVGVVPHGHELPAADVDLARAEQDLAALGEDADVERYREFEAALERARNRIAVAQRTQR